jgi:palmitoyltransferase
MMLLSHIHLILTGKSTSESFAARYQQQREADVLQREFGYLWHNMEKRKVKRKWREDWGGLPVDARWISGSKKQMWVQEMGRAPSGWIRE